MLSTLAKWPLRYLIIVELIYLFYEILLAKNPGHDSPALVLGLLLVAVTMPSSFVLFYLAVYVADLLGYNGGDLKDFLPRFVAVQTGILVNAGVVGWMALSSAKRARRNSVTAEGAHMNVTYNRSANTDPQLQEAASPQVLRSGFLQRYVSSAI